MLCCRGKPSDVIDPNVVSTAKGKVRGKVVTLKNCEDGKPVNVYRKVPFAKPPTGPLRFMPPQPADAWNGVIDGTALVPRPMFQVDDVELMEKVYPVPIPKGKIGIDEDCLYLTVYTTDPRPGKNLPVMVWFFGGGFTMGSEIDYDASGLAGLNDVVVVIPNYRVGIFGFFSLGPNSPCTGNAGILDQHMALRWVQENIDAFGGDKNNVTIFGESAGGVSVHMAMISPLSRGLFHKAISHSGQITMPALFNSEEQNSKVVDITKKHFGIDSTDPHKILEALQALPKEKLVTISDGVVFEKSAIEYLKNKEFPKIPYLIGSNATEGAGLFTMFFTNGSEEGFTEEMAKESCPFQVTDEGWEELKQHYGTNNDGRFLNLLSNIFADGLFAVPAMHDAKVHSETGASVYVYLAAFQLKLYHDDAYGDAMKKPDSCICDHSDDVFMTFGLPFASNDQPVGAKYSKEEQELSRKWMKYLTNFAKTGDPNKGSSVDKQWPEFKSREIIVINHEITTMKDYKEDEIEFWMKKMPTYYTGAYIS